MGGYDEEEKIEEDRAMVIELFMDYTITFISVGIHRKWQRNLYPMRSV